MTLTKGDAQVYRLYDHADALIYVGCSGSVEQRVSGHCNSQPWGEDIAWWIAEDPLPIADALARELHVIGKELPLYNIAGHPSPLPRWDYPSDEAMSLVIRLTCANRTMIWRAFYRGHLPSEPDAIDVRAWLQTLSWKFHRWPCPFAPRCSCVEPVEQSA